MSVFLSLFSFFHWMLWSSKRYRLNHIVLFLNGGPNLILWLVDVSVCLTVTDSLYCELWQWKTILSYYWTKEECLVIVAQSPDCTEIPRSALIPSPWLTYEIAMMEPEILILSGPDLDATSINHTTGWERLVREKLPWGNHQQSEWRERWVARSRKRGRMRIFIQEICFCIQLLMQDLCSSLHHWKDRIRKGMCILLNTFFSFSLFSVLEMNNQCTHWPRHLSTVKSGSWLVFVQYVPM